MKVGFIGLGTMGAGMALNLIRKSGHEVLVHDLRKASAQPHLDAGATWAATVEELGAAADVVFTSVPGPAEMQAVGDKLLAVMKPGTAWFDLTTNSPTVVKEVHARFAARGIALLDAPVSGGPSGAHSGKLAIYIGGDRAVYDRHKALLDVVGDQVMYIGEVGAGNTTKLAHNCASLVIRMAIAEVFSLGVKAGVDPAELWHGIRMGAIGRVRTFDRIGDQYLQNKYEPPAFALKLARKDLRLAMELGEQLGVPMHYAETAARDFDEAIAAGWGDRDSRSPMELQNNRAGVKLAMTAEQVARTMARG